MQEKIISFALKIQSKYIMFHIRNPCIHLFFKCSSYFIVRTPITKKEKAEDYPKNFALLKMAEKFKKNNEE
jgi:hypothetical protein